MRERTVLRRDVTGKCYDGRATDDTAKGSLTSSIQRGTGVDERLQSIQQQHSIEFTVFSLKTLVLYTATFVKCAKETSAKFKVISKFGKM